MMLVVPLRRDLLGLQPLDPAGIKSERKAGAIHFLSLNVPISTVHLNPWTSVLLPLRATLPRSIAGQKCRELSIPPPPG